MNDQHAALCSSAEWGDHLATVLVPWAIGDDPAAALGDDVLELGPGYGLVTDLLRPRVRRLTVVELDEALAAGLATRLAGSGTTVVVGDAAALPFADGLFSAVVSFTMLHHVQTVDHQDRILAEVRRVLRPGAPFAGTDSADSPDFRAFHEGDVCNPIDPATFAARLAAAGFTDVEVETGEAGTRFRAVAPG
jgi:SAM-dependent methyltransferase